MYIIEDTKKVFDICEKHTDVNLKNDYMYMYSSEPSNAHYFKNTETRKEIRIRVTIK